MAECKNHPGKEGVYRCARCRRYFCTACVELIDDKAFCYDCLREIVKESREERKILTMRVVVSSLIAFLIALVSFNDAISTLASIYNTPASAYQILINAPAAKLAALAIGLAFVILSIGLITMRRWSYKYGIVVCAVSFVVEVLRIISLPGGINSVLSSSNRDLAALFVVMVMGPFMLLLAILLNRKELRGW